MPCKGPRDLSRGPRGPLNKFHQTVGVWLETKQHVRPPPTCSTHPPVIRLWLRVKGFPGVRSAAADSCAVGFAQPAMISTTWSWGFVVLGCLLATSMMLNVYLYFKRPQPAAVRADDGPADRPQPAAARADDGPAVGPADRPQPAAVRADDGPVARAPLRRHVCCQSQTTYTRWTVTPRFHVLPEVSAGAFV